MQLEWNDNNPCFATEIKQMFLSSVSLFGEVVLGLSYFSERRTVQRGHVCVCVCFTEAT